MTWKLKEGQVLAYIYRIVQKQPPRGVPRKRCSKNMQQMYRWHPWVNTLRHGCSPVNLLHIFGTPFPKNTSGRLILIVLCRTQQFPVYLILLWPYSRGIFKTLSKTLDWAYFCKSTEWLIAVFGKNSIKNVWQGPRYASIWRYFESF